MKSILRRTPKISTEKLTAQDFVNVLDIQDRILFTKDKLIFTYALIKSNDLSLMTPKEQKRLIDDVSRALGIQKKPFKLILLPRSIDITGMLEQLIELKNSTNDPIRLQLIRKEMDFISTFTEREQDTKENACYLVMWEEGQKQSNQNALLKRMDIAIAELQKSGVMVKTLDKPEITFMCILFTIPQYIHGYSEDDLSPSLPTLEDNNNETES